ncbi:aminotransferase class III-fold pyridoxal phosphate-dependent enzyme [bacterium]|nr:aminotransferase class III-fold pyridoxal phosphate-dependent enzyme [bacterium]
MKYEEIIQKRRELVKEPIYALSEEGLTKAVEKLRTKTPNSGRLFAEAKNSIPGGYQHMLVNKNPWPLTIRKALGTSMWDADNNEFIDYLMMAGPIILGHNYPSLIKEVIKVIEEEGIGSGWSSEWETKGAEIIIKHIKSVEQVRYFQSGTEADMAAVRLARVFTGKRKIIRVGGAYHGWNDEFIYDMQIPYSGTFQTHGIPEEHFANVISVGPNDFDGLEQAFMKVEKDGGVAAVIVEPMGCETGAIPMHPDFNSKARELCDQYQSLLIFDEVVTAFRVALGGAQEFWNIDADITVMGKLITHGFPSSGAIGARREIMDCLAGISPGKPKPFVAGTMAGNSISTAATYWAIKLIEQENAIEKATNAAVKLRDGLNCLFRTLKLPFFSYNVASLVHFETSIPLAVDIRNPDLIMEALERKQAVDNFGVALLAEGIITKYGNRAFTCMAHTDKEIKKTLSAFETVLHMVKRP